MFVVFLPFVAVGAEMYFKETFSRWEMKVPAKKDGIWIQNPEKKSIAPPILLTSSPLFPMLHEEKKLDKANEPPFHLLPMTAR